MRSDIFVGDGSHSGSLKQSSRSSESLRDLGGVDVMTNVGLPAVLVDALIELLLLESLLLLLLELSSESRLKNRVMVLSDSFVLHIGNGIVGGSCCSSSPRDVTGSEKSNDVLVSFFRCERNELVLAEYSDLGGDKDTPVGS